MDAAILSKVGASSATGGTQREQVQNHIGGEVGCSRVCESKFRITQVER